MNYSQLASKEDIEKTMEALEKNGINSTLVETGKDAFERIKTLIPAGASVMNGSSVTLETIGFVDYLKSGTHPWNNLHATIVAEKDPVKQSALRKQSTLSEYYLGSVHALTHGGEMVIASNTGSQLPHVVFTSPNSIFVVGVQKLVASLPDGLKRLEEYVYPLEDKHMKDLGYGGSMISKIVIFKKENKMMGRSVRVVLVNEVLGF